jgi:ACS family hexuronate transporter-like MFS transporter
VPLVVSYFGWHAAFVFTGMMSLTFVLVWALIYREPEAQPLLSAKELAFIRSDSHPAAAVQRLPYWQLLSKRAAWAFLLGKFLTDPVWWFYLFWLPGFLNEKYHVDLVHLGPPLVTIYLAADIGSIGGGWLSSFLLKIGWPLGRARKTAMLVCALSVLSAIFVPLARGNLWLTVALVAIAASAHQGWSANLYTIASDCFPRPAVASVVGLGGLGGAIGGFLVQLAIGPWLDYSHKSYAPLFVIAGSMYLVALLIIQVLLPRYERQAV